MGALPVFDGALNATDSDPLPGVADTPVGTPGVPAKVRSQCRNASVPCGWIVRIQSSQLEVGSHTIDGWPLWALRAVPVFTRYVPPTWLRAGKSSAARSRYSSPALGAPVGRRNWFSSGKSVAHRPPVVG